MPNPFATTESADLGVQASDIVASGLSLVTVLGPIILIGLAIAFAPKIVSLVRRAVGK
jgi:hypothetical protein